MARSPTAPPGLHARRRGLHSPSSPVRQVGGASLSPTRWIPQRSSGRPRPRSEDMTTEDAVQAQQASAAARCHSDSRAGVFTSSSSSSSLSVDPEVSSSSESDDSLLSSSSSESDMSCWKTQRDSLTVQTEDTTKVKKPSTAGCLGCYLCPVGHDPLGHAHRLGGASGSRRLGLGRHANFDLWTAANFGGAATFLAER